MITCPFCGTEVKDPVDQRHVEDDHANNFYCPTYVQKYEDLKLSHYTRNQMKYLVNGQKIYRYTAQIPPFEIVWYTTGILWVYQYDKNSQEPHELHQKKTCQFKTFLQTYERFKVLVPFS